MQLTKLIIIAASVCGVSLSSSAQEQQKIPTNKTSEPIQKQLEIEKTIEQFKRQYIEHSVDPEESRRYLKLIRSNRELSQKVQERELVLKMNEQQIELIKQAQALSNISNGGKEQSGRSQSNLDLTGFIPEKEKANKKPKLQSISRGQVATFSIDGELTHVRQGERLPTGEMVELINEDIVKLKTRTGTVTLRGMQLGALGD